MTENQEKFASCLFDLAILAVSVVVWLILFYATFQFLKGLGII